MSRCTHSDRYFKDQSEERESQTLQSVRYSFLRPRLMKATREMRDNNERCLLAAVLRSPWGFATDLINYGKGKPRAALSGARLVPVDHRALLLRHGDKSMRFGTVTELRAARDGETRPADSCSSGRRCRKWEMVETDSGHRIWPI